MFNYRRLAVTALAFGLGLAATGAAQTDALRNAGERSRDRREIRRDRRALADNRADLDRLSDLITQWSDARTAKDEAARARLEGLIATELRRDLRETAAQAGAAQGETRRDRRELRSDRREVREDRRELQDARVEQDSQGARRELRDDRRDRRDDRRDLRDDRRDAARAEAILGAKRDVARQLVDLQREIDGGGDQEALRARQSRLFDEYQALSRKEIDMGLRELGEDRRELREDRRETREDRRERK